MMNTGKLSAEDLKKQVVEEFGEEWTESLAFVYNSHNGLQAEDEQSKFLFNSVKIVTKQSKSDDDTVKSKISNGFKNLVSKVLRQVLMAFATKIEIYLHNSSNHQIKLEDVKKIVKLWINFDDAASLKEQFDKFDENVDVRLTEIKAAKHEKKSTTTSLESAQ